MDANKTVKTTMKKFCNLNLVAKRPQKFTKITFCNMMFGNGALFSFKTVLLSLRH